MGCILESGLEISYFAQSKETAFTLERIKNAQLFVRLGLIENRKRSVRISTPINEQLELIFYIIL